LEIRRPRFSEGNHHSNFGGKAQKINYYSMTRPHCKYIGAHGLVEKFGAHGLVEKFGAHSLVGEIGAATSA
jgi:hypothetical protein